MRSICRRLCLFLSITAFSLSGSCASAADELFTRTQDVVYGRKDGMALTLDVIAPKENANGAAIVWVISGGWFSNHDNINPAVAAEFTKRGYTVFAVVHGSQPRYAIPEILGDLHRSVRFIRSRAGEYKIDANRIGITGASAGGHLSLMQGTTGTEGNSEAKDPVDRLSSRVQAVACFYPPTDFLNYGKTGENALGVGILKRLRAAFEFKELDATQTYTVITDENKRLEIGKMISPVYQVSPDDAPALIIHGDADGVVPIQQAELIIQKFKEAKVPCDLVVKKGANHGWPDKSNDMVMFADWFDKYLAKK